MSPDDRKQVGDRIRQLEKRFANRATAAEAIGVAKSTLQAWGEGRSDPSFAGLTRLAALTGASLDWIATGKGRGPVDQLVRTVPAPVARPAPADVSDATWVRTDSVRAAGEYIIATVRDLGLELPPAKLAQMIAERATMEAASDETAEGVGSGAVAG